MTASTTAVGEAPRQELAVLTAATIEQAFVDFGNGSSPVLVPILETHLDLITIAAFEAHGKRLASGTADEEVRGDNGHLIVQARVRSGYMLGRWLAAEHLDGYEPPSYFPHRIMVEGLERHLRRTRDIETPYGKTPLFPDMAPMFASEEDHEYFARRFRNDYSLYGAQMMLLALADTSMPRYRVR
jgi:hypothetical protein